MKAAAANPFICSDFSTWMPAVLVKELRQGLQTRGFVGMLILFHAVMVVAMTTTVASLPGASAAARAASADVSNTFFWTLLAVMLLIVLPVRALFGLRAEVDSRTIDLLVLTHLSSWRIVLGKWASLVAQGFLLLVSMMPYGFVRYFAGSVNLADDALRCVALLSGCALLTAAALLCSGLPRMASIPLVLVVAMGLGFSSFRSAAGAAGLAGPISFASDSPMLAVFDGVLLLLFFLVMAVRRIAPPAENLGMMTRLLAVPAFLPIPLLARMGAIETGRSQFTLAAGILMVVCAIELASARFPMTVHWRSFVQKGPIGRITAPFFMPGWPSAFAFTLVAAAASLALVWWGGIFVAEERADLARMAALAIGGLAFPAVVRALGKRPAATAGAFYTLTLAGLCLLAFVSSVFANAPLMPRWWLDFSSILPIAGFWMEFTRGVPGAVLQTVQWTISIVILAAAAWGTFPYWRGVSEIGRGES